MCKNLQAAEAWHVSSQDSDVEVVMETNPALLEAHLACLQDTKAKRLEELFKWRRCAEESW